ncbi:hypothetical protein [Nonomuraea dietziae]|uniref:hypothetical protein n=1 Tax=Nonomuraea dietziae TaxID=65515 RepID=UPI00344197B2
MAKEAEAAFIKRHAQVTVSGVTALVVMLALVDVATDTFDIRRLVIAAALYLVFSATWVAVKIAWFKK